MYRKELEEQIIKYPDAINWNFQAIKTSFEKGDINEKEKKELVVQLLVAKEIDAKKIEKMGEYDNETIKASIKKEISTYDNQTIKAVFEIHASVDYFSLL